MIRKQSYTLVIIILGMFLSVIISEFCCKVTYPEFTLPSIGTKKWQFEILTQVEDCFMV